MSQRFPFPADDYMLIGTVVKAHGIKGELKVAPFAGQTDLYEDYSRLALVAEDGRMTALLKLRKARYQGRLVILKLDTIDTRNEADLTTGMGVLVHRCDLSPLQREGYHPNELEGLPVRITGTETVIGVIKGFIDSGAHQVMVVQNDTDEFLIPMVKEIVTHQGGDEIVIDPPPGLLEINATDA